MTFLILFKAIEGHPLPSEDPAIARKIKFLAKIPIVPWS